MKSIQPHTHEQRTEIVEQLIPLFHTKFGDNLLAIAACASYARGTDLDYSDLELIVFLKEPLEGENDPYLQRIVDGLLIEVEYLTPEAYLQRFKELKDCWGIPGSDPLVGIYNVDFTKELGAKVAAIRHTPAQYRRAAARKQPEVQEAFAKVFNAIGEDNREGIGIVFFDAVLILLHMLAMLNGKPFTTLSRYIAEARKFKVKPDRLDDMLNILVEGDYANFHRLKDVMTDIYNSLERIFAGYRLPFGDASFNPNKPNKIPHR